MHSRLCYCGNVHAAGTLAALLKSLASGPALVRKALGAERLSYGLWLSQQAMRESLRDGHRALRACLQEQKLDVWTMNAFPVGDFHAPVVKFDVYSPSWADRERLSYTLEAAELLALLLPAGVSGTISTLPVGYRSDFRDSDKLDRACQLLCECALGLAALADKEGKSIRLCLEPEPGCLIETGRDLIDFFAGPLDTAARRRSAGDAVRAHLGMCLDTCHHAVLFEDPEQLLASLASEELVIGKIQLSSAAALNPSDPLARSQLQSLDEPRFLHQVRAKGKSGQVAGCDDIPGASSLPDTDEWRVHYHLPIHKPRYGALGTTQSFMTDVLRQVSASHPMPHLEVETYTWGVLPAADRPASPQSLAECIASELRFAEACLQ